MCEEITNEVQEVIDYVLRNEENVKFKVCTECSRDLPCHDWFYNKHPKGKHGRDSKCKECKSNTYNFVTNLRELYYLNIKDDFNIKFRYMSVEQLQKEFNLSFNETNMLINRFKLSKTKVIDSLTDEEVIFMYKSLLNNEIKCFTNGIYKNDKYIIILIKHMINTILKWNRDDICNNYFSKIFEENGLKGLTSTKGFDNYKYLINAFPEYSIYRWELKSSTVGNGFWTDNNLDNALEWLRKKLLEDKNVDNINMAGRFGFQNILEEYNLMGLCATKFKSKPIPLFEKMYDSKFSKEEMLKDNYTFCIDLNCVPRILEDKVYKLIDNYNNLDDRGKTLINEIVRFCENENRFPNEHDLSNKKGYICKTQFYKYFGENTLKQLYNYIIPVYDLSEENDVDIFRKICDGQNYDAIYIKPNKIKCIKCDELKDFTEENFSKGEAQKFGLNYICKKCNTKISYGRNLNKNSEKNNILIENQHDIILWYEAFLKNNLKQMPNFCYEEQNTIDILKYIINIKLGLYTKEQICDVNLLARKQFEEYRIDTAINRLGGKLLALQKCFPELNITNEDVFPEAYSNEDMDNIISEWIHNNNLSIQDLLSKGITLTYNNKMNAMMSLKYYQNNKSRIDMIIWYCNRNNILHPIYNRPIIKWDFDEVSQGFWNNKQNRIDRIKYYSENECNENILDVINDTLKLRAWIYKYFRQESIVKIISYSRKEITLYDLLIDAYPEILSNKILFEWEWHQYSKNDRDSLIKMMRELILFRLNDLIQNIQEDVPKYLNSVYLGKLYPKFTRQISKNRFSSYYEWGCLAFPEYAGYWTPQMFGSTVAYDGVKCGSKQEMMVYEFAKIDMELKYFKSIGNKKSGEYTFELGDEYEYERFCPDFILEYIDVNNKKVKLTKPIIVEFYGMYFENHKCYIYQNYVTKTKIKNQFYNSRGDIIFVGLYPDDLKNRCEGVRNKISNALSKSILVQ